MRTNGYLAGSDGVVAGGVFSAGGVLVSPPHPLTAAKTAVIHNEANNFLIAESPNWQ